MEPTEEEFEEKHLEGSLLEEDGSEKQLLLPQQSQENMFGYLITTSGHVTNNEIETLLQPEFMMSLLSQNGVTSATTSSGSNNSGARTITLCIPPGMISTTAHSVSANPTTQLISTGVNVNGTQILTKTD